MHVTNEMVKAAADAAVAESLAMLRELGLERLRQMGLGRTEIGSVNGYSVENYRVTRAALTAALAAAPAPAGEEGDFSREEVDYIVGEWEAKATAAEAARDAAIARAERAEAGMARLLTAAKILQANFEVRARIHYGADFATHGMPGWLADTAKDIAEAARLAATTAAPTEPPTDD